MTLGVVYVLLYTVLFMSYFKRKVNNIYEEGKQKLVYIHVCFSIPKRNDYHLEGFSWLTSELYRKGAHEPRHPGVGPVHLQIWECTESVVICGTESSMSGNTASSHLAWPMC